MLPSCESSFVARPETSEVNASHHELSSAILSARAAETEREDCHRRLLLLLLSTVVILGADGCTSTIEQQEEPEIILRGLRPEKPEPRHQNLEERETLLFMHAAIAAQALYQSSQPSMRRKQHFYIVAQTRAQTKLLDMFFSEIFVQLLLGSAATRTVES